MAEPCQNPKCDYFGTTGCFARMCKERCRDTRCVMFGQDHFAKICCYKCNNRECFKFGQYHPPGEICYDRNTFHGGQQYPSQSLSPEQAHIAIDTFRQLLPNVQQQQTFDPFASLSFPSPTTGNHIPRSPFNGGWPFGQN